jgi:LacI family transcriptional regulator
MVTIYDVAAQAGVSPATVSRVFNGMKVKPSLAESVRRAADELGFIPNRNARRLRTSSSEIIAMMIPDIENPFFTVMTRAVGDIARAKGYSVMLCNTDEEPAREEEYLRAAVSDPVAGIICVPSGRTTNLDFALERNVPVVCVDRRLPGYAVDAVVGNNIEGAALATRTLFGIGYRRVACVSGPEGVETADDRFKGWALAYSEVTGSAPPPTLSVRTSYTVSGGESAAVQLLVQHEPPDAIIAANNKLASGVLRVLAAAEKLPPVTGLVAFDGLPLMMISPIGVHVAYLPAREMGETAAKMLLERIGGLREPAREVVLPVMVRAEESGISLLGERVLSAAPGNEGAPQPS